MSDPSPNPAPRRRWFRFSLRTLLILVAVVALPLAWVAKERRQSWYEKQFAEQLKKRDLKVWLAGPYDSWKRYTGDGRQGWWRDVGRQILGERILAIEGMGVHFDDLTPLAELSNLEHLGLIRTSVTDLTPLARVTRLRELAIVSPTVRDLTPLAGLTNLQGLILVNTAVSDLTPLMQNTSLETVNLSGSPVTQEQVEALQKALPNCKIQHDLFP